MASLGGLGAMVVLANYFLHLNHNSVHRRWALTPHSPLSFFCASSRQLVSNIYLLPFQLDKDNREAWLHRGLCHLTAMVATAEVMS